MNAHSIRNIVCGMACGLSVTVLCRPSQALPTFADGTFSNADWTTTKIIDTTSGGTAQVVANQDGTQGNPIPSRRTKHTYTIGLIRAAHLQLSALYDPLNSGAITALTYSYDLNRYIAPVASPGCVAYALLLLQNGTYYVGPTDTICANSWATKTSPSLTAASFQARRGTPAPNPGTGPDQPDFSCKGAPIQFGYETSNSNTNPALTDVTESGIDNWSVTVESRRCCGTPGTPPCCGQVDNVGIACAAPPGGGFVYSFDVTNNSGQAAPFLLLSPSAGSTFTVSPNVLPGPFPSPSTTPVHVAIGGNTLPGQSICVDVKLTNGTDQCCSLRACGTLPSCDCLQVVHGSLQCDHLHPGGHTYTYTFSLTNLTGQAVSDVFVLPESPAGLTVTPQLFPFPSGSQTLAISGAAPGSTVCFRLAPRDQCCSTEQCLTLPDCNP
jgi:hypothetical protein